jgi:hypothetical protein
MSDFACSLASPSTTLDCLALADATQHAGSFLLAGRCWLRISTSRRGGS